MNREVIAQLPTAGVGRIRREGYVVHVGQFRFELDELRNYQAHDIIRAAVAALKPLTAAECLWLQHYLGGVGDRHANMMRMLAEFV